MSKTLFTLRIFGIAAFLLFMISKMFQFPSISEYYLSQVQQIFMLVSFFIFAFLILLQLYNAFVNTIVDKPDEKDQ
jgi:hypothetical protein